MDLSNHEEIPDSGFRPMDEEYVYCCNSMFIGAFIFKKLVFLLLFNCSVVHSPPMDGRAYFHDPGPRDMMDIAGQSNERPNEDNLPHISELEVMPHDYHIENLQMGGKAGFQDPGPSHQMDQLNERLNEETVSQVPEREVIRDAIADFQTERLPVWPEHGNDTMMRDRSPDEMLNEKETLSPDIPDILYPGEHSLPFELRSEAPASVVSPEAPEIIDSHVSFGECLISSLATRNDAWVFWANSIFPLFKFAFSCSRTCVT